MSKFIVIEGLEGAGKTNAQRIVTKLLQERGQKTILTREPGGTPIAENLRDLWKYGVDGELTTLKAEVLMLYAARTQLVETIIKPNLEKGIFVVGDRHNLSTIAYQGGGRGIDRHLLDSIKELVLGDFKADLTIFLDVEPQIGLARAKKRGELDRIEQQEIAFFNRTRKAYLNELQQDPNAIIIDANQSFNKVSNDIKIAFKNWLEQSDL